jgi:hypothetical protein
MESLFGKRVNYSVTKGNLILTEEKFSKDNYPQEYPIFPGKEEFALDYIFSFPQFSKKIAI